MQQVREMSTDLILHFLAGAERLLNKRAIRYQAFIEIIIKHHLTVRFIDRDDL